MSKADQSGETLTAAECAQKTGLTVKALRVYERQGLVKPKRTLKDWRIYDSADLARLGEVTALQALGLKLADIAKLLRDSPSEINRMLELQQDELLQRKARIDTGLATIGALRQRTAMGETLTISDIASSIKETQMTAATPESIAWKRYEQMRPRVAIVPSNDSLQACLGHYLFEDGATFQVTTENGRLLAQMHGQPAFELFNEAPDAWFYTAVPAQITFTRNASREIKALTLHQNGVDLVANRIDEKVAQQERDKLAQRIATGTPHPDSERLARILIEHHIKGQPCDEILEPALAFVVAEQREGAKQFVAEFGAFKSLEFLAITEEGWDAFRANFENGEMDMSVYISPSGKISGALLEPPKAESFWKKLRQKFQ